MSELFALPHIEYKEAVKTKADLPITETDGVMRLVQDEESFYYFSEGAWILISFGERIVPSWVPNGEQVHKEIVDQIRTKLGKRKIQL